MQQQMLNDLDKLINQIVGLGVDAPLTEPNRLYDQLVQTIVMLDDVSRGQADLNAQLAKLGDKALSLQRSIDADWARRIADSAESLLVLRQHPYLDDYWLLVNRELTLARLTGLKLDGKSRLLIVGEGSLPLTTCQLLQHTGARADVICQYDDDVMLAKAVTNVLGLALNVQYVSLADLSDGNYDLVVIRSLCVDDERYEPNSLLSKLRLSGRLILRSATGARQLLQPAAVNEDLAGGQLLVEFHPTDNVVPSSLIYRKVK